MKIQTKPKTNTGHPTDFQKDRDPFSSMIALPANRYVHLAPPPPTTATCPCLMGQIKNTKEKLNPNDLNTSREYAEREGIVASTSSSGSQDLPTRSTLERQSTSSRSASTNQAESSRTHLAQAVSMSEAQSPADLAGPNFFPLESARPL